MALKFSRQCVCFLKCFPGNVDRSRQRFPGSLETNAKISLVINNTVQLYSTVIFLNILTHKVGIHRLCSASLNISHLSSCLSVACLF